MSKVEEWKVQKIKEEFERLLSDSEELSEFITDCGALKEMISLVDAGTPGDLIAAVITNAAQYLAEKNVNKLIPPREDDFYEHN